MSIFASWELVTIPLESDFQIKDTGVWCDGNGGDFTDKQKQWYHNAPGGTCFFKKSVSGDPIVLFIRELNPGSKLEDVMASEHHEKLNRVLAPNPKGKSTATIVHFEHMTMERGNKVISSRCSDLILATFDTPLTPEWVEELRDSSFRAFHVPELLGVELVPAIGTNEGTSKRENYRSNSLSALYSIPSNLESSQQSKVEELLIEWRNKWLKGAKVEKYKLEIAK